MNIRSIALSTLICGMVVPAMGDDAGGPKWYDSYEEGREAADAQGLPLLLHFYADWCGPCRRMEQTVLNSDLVTAQCGKVVAAKVNADHERDVADRFSVEGFPTDVLLSQEGDVIMRRTGYASPSEYAAFIHQSVPFGERTQPVSAWLIPADVKPTEDETKLGLMGFSPVSITRDRVWRHGDSNYRWTHRGVVYHLVDADELQVFQAEPNRYVPRLGGLDPLVLVNANQRVQGDIQHGAFYRDGLYLHSSRENQQGFIESPEVYADRAESALAAEAKAVTMTELPTCPASHSLRAAHERSR